MRGATARALPVALRTGAGSDVWNQGGAAEVGCRRRGLCAVPEEAAPGRALLQAAADDGEALRGAAASCAHVGVAASAGAGPERTPARSGRTGVCADTCTGLEGVLDSSKREGCGRAAGTVLSTGRPGWRARSAVHAAHRKCLWLFTPMLQHSLVRSLGTRPVPCGLTCC